MLFHLFSGFERSLSLGGHIDGSVVNVFLIGSTHTLEADSLGNIGVHIFLLLLRASGLNRLEEAALNVVVLVHGLLALLSHGLLLLQACILEGGFRLLSFENLLLFLLGLLTTESL